MTAGSAIAPRPQAVAPSPKGAYPGQPTPSAPSAGSPHRRRPLPSLTLGNKAAALALLTLTLLVLTFIPAPHAAAQATPSFGSATITDQTYIQRVTVVNLTLPAATSGTPPLAYTLGRAGGGPLPIGLTFDSAPDARVLSGTPTGQGTADYIYTVTTLGGATDTITFRIIVLRTFTFETLATISQTYTAGTPVSLTLPAATGGTAPLTYQLTPFGGSLAAGLAFDTTTHVVSGTPTTAHAQTTFAYTVMDSNSLIGAGGNLEITIREAPPVTFDATAIAPQTYPISNAVNVTLPATSGGYGAVTYAINPTPPLPDGLTFTAATRVLNGTPTAAQAAMTYTYTATDSDPAGANSVPLTFTIAITDDPPMIILADGPRISADEGALVTLNAGDSSDPEGQALTFLWAQDAADDMQVTLTGATTATATFTAPEERTTLNFDLTVTDQTGQPTMARLTVTVGRSQFDNINRTILPEVTRAMMDTTVSAIARRTEQAAADHDASGATFSLGGQSTLAGVLQSNGEALNTGAFNVKSLLGRSAFALPLNQAGGPLAGVTLWGNGAYRNLSGNSATVDWDGDLFGATVGGDAWLTDTLLTGLAVSWADGTFDYTDSSGADPAPGTYQATLTSLHPYVSTSLLDGQVTLWATGGYGWGEVEITDTADPTAEGTVTADTRLATAAVGGAGRLLNQPGLLTPDGTTTVRVKAEALTTAIKAEQQGDRLAGLTTDARRLRLTLEGSHEQPLPHGAHLTPSVGVGLRHDAGDGRTGTGAEVSGGLRYAHPALRLTMESRGRVLLAHGGDYDDWSVSGRVTLAPGAQGQGLAVTLEPTYQTTTSAGGLAQLWEHGTANRPAPSGPTTPQGLMEATVAYGLPVGDHLLTPYGGMTLGAADARTYRLGSRVSLAHRLNMSLEGARKGATGTIPVDHGVRVQLEWHW